MLDYTNEELLVRYRLTGDIKIKKDLTMRYLYIVRSIAIQMRDVFAGFAQLDDIINEGVIVLMGAIDKFDESKNAKFETYVSKRIRGMVIDLARKQDWVPRGLRKSLRDLERERNTFFADYGREPTITELADILEMPEDKLISVMGKANLSAILSLDMVLEETADNFSRTQVASTNRFEQPEASLLDNELKEMLKQGITSLKETEQLVVSLYYEEELNMKQIAEVIGVSEPRVSQIHAKAINKLKEYMVNRKQMRREYVSGIL
ncbi:RNA polymerase sigma factor for flagellar operon FliA [Lachnospiraceae bacterium PF1-21]|uniref:sigma-70 family RNA polymerase sigma factor n=1 Tax=Ohessyouella blattaphilus TaxID=2949333 RepID=UPI002568CE89|nr:FliA/WhiG family RNA polymerase sigma factor [Lachnospiraceae bacterium OttesenSCG-928-J05]